MITGIRLSMLIVLFGQIMKAENSYYVLNLYSADSQSFKYEDDASSSIMDGATDYTIEAWVKPISTIIHNKVILKHWNLFALTLYKDADKRIYFTHYGTSNTYVNSIDNVINLNEWNHVAVICSSVDNSTKLFVNGVDVSRESYPALTLTGGNDNDNFYLGYGGGGTYPDIMAREIRVKKGAEDISNLHTNISDHNYTTDSNTALLFHVAEGNGTTTKNEASGIEANFGWGDPAAHFPTWVELSSTLALDKYNTTKSSVHPNHSAN